MKTYGPPNHPPERVDMFTPQVKATGRTFAKIDGVWCAETRAGTWRPAAWLCRGLVDDLLDHIHES